MQFPTKGIHAAPGTRRVVRPAGPEDGPNPMTATEPPNPVTDPPPVQQRDDAVTIQTAEMLASVYRCVLHGITRRRRDGAPTADLQQLARELRRAHIAATSQPRHQLAEPLPPRSCSNGQDGVELIGVTEAATLLSLSTRQT